jgi:hypothetical protein
LDLLFLCDLGPHRSLSAIASGTLDSTHRFHTGCCAFTRMHPKVSWVNGKATPETHEIILPMTCRICLRSTRGASQVLFFQGGYPNIEEFSYTPSMILQQACRLGFRTGLLTRDHNCPVSSCALASSCIANSHAVRVLSAT